MDRLTRQSVFRLLVISSTLALARCGLLEMSQMLWTKTVSGGLTKIGKLDPLRVPVIKVDQSEGDTSYRMILRNLEIVGLNESYLESIHIGRGGLKSNLSEHETGFVSYSDLRDVESIRYRFHTMMREPGVPNESFEAVVSPVNQAAGVIRPSSRYQEDNRFARLQQAQHGFGTFEQSRQYYRQMPSRPVATSDSFYRGNLRAHSDFTSNAENFENLKRPVYVQPVYTQRARDFQGYRQGLQEGVDVVDCEDDTNDYHFRENQKSDRQYAGQQGADGRHYGKRIGDVEVSASEIVETRLKNRGDARPPASYNREQPPRFGNAATKERTREQSGYIDIVYADGKTNGSMRRFGNVGIVPKENQRVYGIENIMKDIKESARFFSHNFTEGEALTKRNDMVKTAMEAKRLKDLPRYANSYQEQQGYFEEGMQLIYHYGGMDEKNGSASRNIKLNDTRRIKRAHPEEAAEDDVMHVIFRIRVPLLRVKSEYTLMGKVGREMLRGNGLLDGNFTDLVGDFTLELKKVNEETMIVRSARAKLFAKNRKVTLQGMNEEGPVQAILSHGLMAAEAVAAMLADDFATKGLSEKTADAVIFRMYKDLPVN